MDMQKRLIEELAECRGGPNRLRKMRKEFDEKRVNIEEELVDILELLDTIDDVTGDSEAAEEKEEKDAYQEESDAVTDREPVDSIGE
jgi:hypothetical protein